MTRTVPRCLALIGGSRGAAKVTNCVSLEFVAARLHYRTFQILVNAISLADITNGGRDGGRSLCFHDRFTRPG